MGQSLRGLQEGPDDCPMCDGPCRHEFKRGDFALGDPPEKHPDHPDNPKRKEAKPVTNKRPRGKRRPAEDRARHLGEDR